MEHAYKLLFIFRPLVWAMIGCLVVALGNRFLKRLLNLISIFLFVISIGGAWVMSGYYERVADPYYEATADDWTKCIVGSVTLICFMVFAFGYMMMARGVDTGDGKAREPGRLASKLVGWMMLLMVPFAIMGYCLPFFLLDSIAGIIVGVIGECVGVLVAIKLIRSPNKKKDEKLADNASDKPTKIE